jgi:hypothetical protein
VHRLRRLRGRLPERAAMLFTGAKVAHLVKLPQGQVERPAACSTWSSRWTTRASAAAPTTASVLRGLPEGDPVRRDRQDAQPRDTCDPEVCLSRLRQADPVDIANCLYVLHGAVVPGILLPEGVPEEVRDVPADTNPTLYFSVGRSSASDEPEQPAVDGDVVTVRAGETIHVSVKFGADAEQAYLKVYDGPDEPVVDDAREQLVVTTLMGEWVDGFTASEDGRTLEFIAPDTLDPVVLYARALDDRRGAAFATLQFLAIREGHEEP